MSVQGDGEVEGERRTHVFLLLPLLFLLTLLLLLLLPLPFTEEISVGGGKAGHVVRGYARSERVGQGGGLVPYLNPKP